LSSAVTILAGALFALLAGCWAPPPPYRTRLLDRRTRKPVAKARAEIRPVLRGKEPEKPGEPEKPVKLGESRPFDLNERGELMLHRDMLRPPEGGLAPLRAEMVFRAPGYVPGRARIAPQEWDGAWRVYSLRPRPDDAEGELPPEDLPPPKVIAPAAFSPYSFYRDGSGPFVGVRPLVRIDRSVLDEELELDGLCGVQVGLNGGGGALMGLMSLNWVPLEGERSGQDVHVYWFDAGLGGACPFTDADLSLMPAWRIEIGPSLLFMDFEKGSYDTGGLGLFGRFGLGLWGRDARFALEAVADVHGWVGGDSHQVQAAWAASVGAQLILRF
jgi:hypothetical protein